MYELYLCHHGIKGQKWGVRRFQNSDGTRTNAGRERYHNNDLKWHSQKTSPPFHQHHMNDAQEKPSLRSKVGTGFKSTMSAVAPYVKSGAKIVNRVVSRSIENAGQQVLTAALIYGGYRYIKGKYGEEEADNIYKYMKKKK